MKVLVVDDFRSQRRYTVDALEKVSATVVEAEDGNDGLEKAQNDVYDLILTDKEMPGLDGFEMSKAIREGSQNKRTPIIMISSQTEDKADAKQYGISGWLSKPVMVDDIFSIVKRFRTASGNGQSKHNVLLLNNSEFKAGTWKRVLELPGIQYDKADDAREALSMMRKKSYEAVVSACELPEVDGLSFTRGIKSDENLCKIPVFLISDNQGMERKANQAGADYYFTEPLNPEVIKQKLKRILR